MSENKLFSEKTESLFKDVKFAMSQKKEGERLSRSEKEGMRSRIAPQMEELTNGYKRLVKGDKDTKPMSNLSFGQYINQTLGFEINKSEDKGMVDFYQFMEVMGINPMEHTLEHLTTYGDVQNVGRWLVPVFINEAIRTGLNENMMIDLTAATRSVNLDTVEVPSFKDIYPMTGGQVGELETPDEITIRFDSKLVRLRDIRRNISITDKLVRNVPIDLLAIQLDGVSRWMNTFSNSMLVNTLVNGDANPTDNSAPTVGVKTTSSWKYIDLKKVAVRMANLQYAPTHIIGNENETIEVSLIDEIKGYSGDTRLMDISMQGDVRRLTAYSHGLVPDNNVMLMDSSAAIVRLVGSGMFVEPARDAKHAKTDFVIHEQVGFYKLFRDAAVLIDNSLDFASNGFPTWMDIEAYQKAVNYQ